MWEGLGTLGVGTYLEKQTVGCWQRFLGTECSALHPTQSDPSPSLLTTDTSLALIMSIKTSVITGQDSMETRSKKWNFAAHRIINLLPPTWPSFLFLPLPNNASILWLHQGSSTLLISQSLHNALISGNTIQAYLKVSVSESSKQWRLTATDRKLTMRKILFTNSGQEPCPQSDF